MFVVHSTLLIYLLAAQIGFTESRYIIVLNTDAAVRDFTTKGKTTLNATASGTAGAETATAKATDTDLSQQELVVYKDTDGVFGGATLGETSVERKDLINQDAYGNNVLEQDILSGQVQPTKSAARLYAIVNNT